MGGIDDLDALVGVIARFGGQTKVIKDNFEA